MEYNRLIDHTLLAPDATREQIKRICDEAKQYHFASVCVNPGWIKYCKEQLKGSEVNVCTVIGFPLGATLMASKISEAKESLFEGADELDMVINIGRLKDHDDNYVKTEIQELKRHHRDLPSYGRRKNPCLQTCERGRSRFCKDFNRLLQRGSNRRGRQAHERDRGT